MSWVNRSSVKEGTPTTGEKVTVIWGKSKKTYAVIVRESESVLSPTREDDEIFDIELASPAAVMSEKVTEENFSKMEAKLDDVLDRVSGITMPNFWSNLTRL